MDLPPEMVAILASLAPLFSDRVWVQAQILAVGAILTTGNRTVCSVLRIMGLSHERHFTNYHRVLTRGASAPVVPLSAPRPEPKVPGKDPAAGRNSGDWPGSLRKSGPNFERNPRNDLQKSV